jgi:hypothetical protein
MATTVDKDENQFKIRLESPRNGRLVVFNTSPALTENKSVSYSTLNPVHMPGTYYVYENSPGRKFDLSPITLVSRNQVEARLNLQRVTYLRGWTMPYFGSTETPSNVLNESNAQDELKDWLGAPPETLYFSAYATTDSRGQIYRVPVVIESLSINYPNDVDYIPTASRGSTDKLGGVPFPTITSITCSLAEQHSANEFEKFNLIAYRNGVLTAF